VLVRLEGLEDEHGGWGGGRHGGNRSTGTFAVLPGCTPHPLCLGFEYEKERVNDIFLAG
jgi:hypothetical protein